MNDGTMSVGKLIAAAAWVGVVLLLAAGGALMVNGFWHAGVFFTESACALSAFAAVRSIRCYFCRLANLVVSTSRLDEPAEVRVFPRQPVR